MNYPGKIIVLFLFFLILSLWNITANAVVLNIDKVENQPLPSETTIIILDEQENEIAREETDDKGALIIDLPDGNYTLKTEDGRKIGFIEMLGGIPTIRKPSSPGTPPRQSGLPEKSAEGSSGKPFPEKGVEDTAGKSSPEKVTEKTPHKPFVGDDIVKANQHEINKLTEPILEDMPSGEGLGGKIGSGLLGGLTGGMSGGMPRGITGLSGGSGGFPGPKKSGPKLAPKPKGDWLKLEGGSKGKTMIDLTASANDDDTGLNIGMMIKKSPEKGAPHLILLQHEDGEIIQPIQVVIFEKWAKFTMTVSVWRETYVDGQLVSREHMSTSTSSWNELLGTYRAVIEGPAIWQRLGTGPFKQIRGVIAEFKIPVGFDPSKWSIIAHVTGKDKDALTGKKIIKTVPFIANFGEDFKVIETSMTRFQLIH